MNTAIVSTLPQFLVGKLCVQHGDFTKSACWEDLKMSLLSTQYCNLVESPEL
jgi:hypothetical protein